MAPATSTGLGLAQARAVDGHPAPPRPNRAPSSTFSPWGRWVPLLWDGVLGGVGHLPMDSGMQAAASRPGNELGRASRRLGGDELGYGVRLGWKGYR